MFDQKKLDRINELAKKNKAEGLTDIELKERDELRKEYLDNFRSHFRSRLDNVKVVHTQEEYDECIRKQELEEQEQKQNTQEEILEEKKDKNN